MVLHFESFIIIFDEVRHIFHLIHDLEFGPAVDAYFICSLVLVSKVDGGFDLDRG